MTSKRQPDFDLDRHKAIEDLDDAGWNQILIDDLIGHYDTIGLHLNRKPANDDFEKLKSTTICGKVNLHRSMCTKWDPKSIFKWRLVVQQPTTATIDMLKRITATRQYRISQVHIALDLCVASQKQADVVHEWIDNRISQRWPGKHPGSPYKGTTYLRAKAHPNRNIAIYSDKDSKITKSPCTHIEFKFDGSQIVKQLGIENLDDLVTLEPQAFFQKYLIIEVVDSRKLGRQIMGRSKAKKPHVKRYGPSLVMDYEVRAGDLVKRAATADKYQTRYPTVRRVRDHCKQYAWFRLASVVKRIDILAPPHAGPMIIYVNDTFLPPSPLPQLIPTSTTAPRPQENRSYSMN